MDTETPRLFPEHEIRETHSLNGEWKYYFPKSGTHLGRETIPDADARSVQVPCAWESLEDYINYRGEAIARRNFELQEGAAIRLVFKGVSHTARVFLDGVELCQHHNAYTPFAVAIPFCEAGVHTLDVHISNLHGDISALHVPNDYYNYGGITRPVELQILRSSLFIDYIHFTPSQTEDGWCAGIEVRLQNLGEAQVEDISVVLKRNADALPMGEYEFKGVSVPHGETLLTCSIPCHSAEVWSPTFPALYFLHCSIESSGGPLDDLIDRVGFRSVEAHGEQLLLNGDPVFLKGFNRHEDHPEYGCALPFEAMQRDLELLCLANANAVRTSHYPSDERFLDLCDELGIMVWEENHARGLSIEQMRHPKFREQCAACNSEMVRAHLNHPSILIWGILNECASDSEEGREHFAEQFAQIEALDPSRPTTFASCQHAGDRCQDLPDICSWNTYYNWYEGEAVAPALERTISQREAEGMAGKPFIMSEFGAGAIPGFFDPVRKAKWSEERQAELLDEYLEVLMAHPRLCGVFVWQFCDIRVDEAWAMQRPRTMNNKGIVDEWRRKKIAFDVVKRHFEQR